MRKQIVRNRGISLCLVLAMLFSFPGVARAEKTESPNGDLSVVSTDYVYWHYEPELPSGNWETTLEGYAAIAYGYMFPLVVHPVRNPGWVDSGRNDESRETLAEEYRYRGAYWQTTPDGVMDVESGSEDPNSDYNLFLDAETATLHLKNAYLKGQYCLSLTDNVSTIMGGNGNALTIDLEGENKITAYYETDESSQSASAVSMFALSGDNSGEKLRMEEGSELEIIVKSGKADLSDVFSAGTDLSQTLSKGVLLTENNTEVISNSWTISEEIIKKMSVILGDVKPDTWVPRNLEQYKEQLREEFLEAGENSFLMDEGAVYHMAVAGVSPVQISVNVKSEIDLLNSDLEPYPQVKVSLESDDAAEKGEDPGEGTTEDGNKETSPPVIDLNLTQDDCKRFIVLPEGSLLLPEDASFVLEESGEGTMNTYPLSIQYPEPEEETGTDENHSGGSSSSGSSSFTVEYAGNSGRDWFFKVHATGKAGDGCGFYVNGAPVPTAVAHIRSKSES